MKQQLQHLGTFFKTRLRGESSEDPAEQQAEKELEPRPSNVCKPPSLFLGILIGFLLRLAFEAVKVLFV